MEHQQRPRAGWTLTTKTRDCSYCSRPAQGSVQDACWPYSGVNFVPTTAKDSPLACRTESGWGRRSCLNAAQGRACRILSCRPPLILTWPTEWVRSQGKVQGTAKTPAVALLHQETRKTKLMGPGDEEAFATPIPHPALLIVWSADRQMLTWRTKAISHLLDTVWQTSGVACNSSGGDHREDTQPSMNFVLSSAWICRSNIVL